MRKRPDTLALMSLLYLGVALSFPVQILVLYEHRLREMNLVLAKLSGLNWLVMAATIFCAYFVRNASPWTRFLIPITFMFVTWNNLIVGAYNTDYTPQMAFLGTLGFAALNLPLLQPAVLSLILDPRKRWWLSAPRRKISVPINIAHSLSDHLKASTFDLSNSGLYIPTATGEAYSLRLNSVVKLCLNLTENSHVYCEGRVVRHSEGKGNYPTGVGIEFTNMPRGQRDMLNAYLAAQ